jgi:hypothetical protein
MSSEHSLAGHTLVMSGGSKSLAVNGQYFVDADVLTAAGVTDLSGYGGGDNRRWDIFLDKS